MSCKTHPSAESVAHIQVSCATCGDADTDFFCPVCRDVLRRGSVSRGHRIVAVDHPIGEHCGDPEALFTPEGCVTPSMDESLEEILERASREYVPTGAPA